MYYIPSLLIIIHPFQVWRCCFVQQVVHKFYEIRQQSLEEDIEDASWEDKCECLLHDSSEMWTFSNPEETSTSKYIVSSRKLAV